MLKPVQGGNPYTTTSSNTQYGKNTSKKNCTCPQIVYQRVLSMAHSAGTYAQKGLDAARVGIGAVCFRDTFFFPMFGSAKLRSEREKREATRHALYWDSTKPTSTLYPGQKNVREHFISKEAEITLDVDGQSAKFSYMVIEPKMFDGLAPVYNLGIMLGSQPPLPEGRGLKGN